MRRGEVEEITRRGEHVPVLQDDFLLVRIGGELDRKAPPRLRKYRARNELGGGGGILEDPVVNAGPGRSPDPKELRERELNRCRNRQVSVGDQLEALGGAL